MFQAGCTFADLECLVLSAWHAAGEPAPSKSKVWIIARQHPGESMAEVMLKCILPTSQEDLCPVQDSGSPMASVAIANSIAWYIWCVL